MIKSRLLSVPITEHQESNNLCADNLLVILRVLPERKRPDYSSALTWICSPTIADFFPPVMFGTVHLKQPQLPHSQTAGLKFS